MMRVLSRRRQVLLLLVAILLPCLVLGVLLLRLIAQERELAASRRGDQRRQAVELIRRELLGRLERIKLDEVASLADGHRPAAYRNPAVALAGWVREGKLVLPWEADPAVARFRELLNQPHFEPHIRRGEQREFVAGDLAGAIRAYEDALRVARQPAQSAYARMVRARALDKSGRTAEALADFRALLAAPPEISDEDGIPLRLYAAERLLESSLEQKGVLEIARWAVTERPWLPPAGCYIVSTVTEKLARTAADARHRELARDIHKQVVGRIRLAEQAVALQGDFARLDLQPAGPEPAWVAYGSEAWLVSATPSGAVIAVRAAEVFAAFLQQWNGPKRGVSGLRLLTAREPGGDLLGREFPGMKVAFALDPGTAAQGGPMAAWPAYYAALGCVLCAALLGAWLLWRDLRREVRLADMQAQFVASVSHELKTPLTAIRMFAETLQLGRSKDPDTQAEYLDTIVQECERLTRLVDGVLQFAKIERGKKTYHLRPVELAGTVRAAARAMDYPLAQKGFDLRLNVQDDLPPVRADSDALEQAVLNLLSNAMKYSGDQREIELALRGENGRALIQVTDHGVGIAPEERVRIFEKFYRAATPENQLIPGTGLGLTLVAQIVKAHGGEVEVESAPGRGSTFTIRLPLAENNEHEPHTGSGRRRGHPAWAGR